MIEESTKAFVDHLEKLMKAGLERARDVVSRIPADPGWRACICLMGNKLDGDRVELRMCLIPIAHWGVLRPVHTFGPFSGSGALFGGLVGGASAPVPISADGAVLNGEGFWGLAAPHETNEDMMQKFDAEVKRQNDIAAEFAEKRAARTKQAGVP